jgi:hypothetical protein
LAVLGYSSNKMPAQTGAKPLSERATGISYS